MKKNPLLGALPLLAKMLGRRLGVRVVIGADEAHTDGATIFLPALPADDAALAILANGYIDHEAAHLRYTDFTASKPPGVAGELANLLEDIRIEQALGAAYPGSRDNLAALIAALEAQQPLTPPADAAMDQQVFAGLVTLLRARLLGQTALAPAAATLEARLEQQLPEGVVTKLLALAFGVRHTTSTAEVIALAQRIVAMLEEEAQAPPPSASTGGGAEAAPPGSGAAASSASTGGGAGTDGARRAALQDLLAADGGSAPDLGDQARAYLNQRAAETSAQTGVTIAENDPTPPLGYAGDRLRDCARAATAALRRRLGVLIQAQQQEASWRSRRGRRLATARLYQTALPHPALFARRDRREAPDTAVALLLDRSSSMHDRITLAGQAVLATALALDTLPGVVSAVSAFPGSQDDRVIPLKAFSERAHRVAGRFALRVDSGTPLTPALWRVADDLLQRPEVRRLAIVVTDGAPCNPHTVRDLIARCRAGGIEVIGLGIATEPDLINGLFGPREGITINRIEELAPALFRLLEQRLAAVA
ncbi:MAG TPA: hypothetical protein PK018_14270 [Candidatus Competibacter sp.]|nr:hypothetical protein [Candidatus Competibacter sp.]